MENDKRPSAHGLVPADDAEALYEQAPCGYLSYAPDGTVTKVNQTLLAWSGYSRDDVVGRKRFVDLLTPGGRIYHETHLAPLLRMQSAVEEIAFTMMCADGRRLPVLVNARLLLGEDGEPVVTLTSVFNATDRRRYERELMLARRRAEEAVARSALMQTVAAELAAAGDLAEVSGVLCHTARDVLGASSCALWLRREDLGAPERPAAVAASTGVAGSSSHPAVFDLPSAFIADDDRLRRGHVAALAAEEASTLVPWASSVLGGDRHGVVALAPLMELGRVTGLLGCRFEGRDTLDAAQVDLLLALAGQAGLAVPRARLFEQQRDVTHALQRSLLPTDLPTDERFSLATAYRPALHGPAVGGDWYDAFWLDRDRLAVVVGDVVGRGVHAAAAMGQLRSAIRALASLAPHPGPLLEGLDNFVEGVPAASSATVVYAVLDLATGRATYACAGHPPPVLLDAAGRSTLLWGGRSVPLGVRVGSGHRAEAEVTLPAGSRLLLYTDGLVERRDMALDVRIDHLAVELTRHSAQTPQTLVESVADAMLQDMKAPDDVCLLCLSLAFASTGARGSASR